MKLSITDEEISYFKTLRAEFIRIRTLSSAALKAHLTEDQESVKSLLVEMETIPIPRSLPILDTQETVKGQERAGFLPGL